MRGLNQTANRLTGLFAILEAPAGGFIVMHTPPQAGANLHGGEAIVIAMWNASGQLTFRNAR